MPISVLIIGYVWPEPTSSAAGVRTRQIVDACLDQGWRVTFTSPSKENDFTQNLRKIGVHCEVYEANDSRFDEFVAKLEPSIVIFDRFVIEEQFGWRVRNQCPKASRLLDTQDLHFLRRGRASERGADYFGSKRDVARDEETIWRELASIYRCDRTWVVSDYEAELLRIKFGIDAKWIGVVRFAYPMASGSIPGFDKRSGFGMIGNFRHPPNYDAVFWLYREIWPRIRAQMPQAQLTLYGAYPPKECMELTDEAMGFKVAGWVEDSGAALASWRVNLAPLRFGAGIKGKICEGWGQGTPVVTTPIGAEGMSGDASFGGAITADAQEFARAAIRLHEDCEAWQLASQQGLKIVEVRFNSVDIKSQIIRELEQLNSELESRRQKNSIGQILWHQTLRSTEYFSRWIEIKNELKTLKKI